MAQSPRWNPIARAALEAALEFATRPDRSLRGAVTAVTISIGQQPRVREFARSNGVKSATDQRCLVRGRSAADLRGSHLARR